MSSFGQWHKFSLSIIFYLNMVLLSFTLTIGFKDSSVFISRYNERFKHFPVERYLL